MSRKSTEKKPKWLIYVLNSMAILKNNKIDIVLIDQNIKIGQFRVVVRL